MKKILLIVSFALTLSSNAQITLEHVHIVPTGRIYVQTTDNTPRKLTASGSNMVWDFSMLNANVKDTTRTGMPTWYKGHTNFTSSNYAYITNSDTSTVNFAELNNSSFYSNGSYSSTDNSLLIFQLRMKLFNFPCTYNDNFSHSVLYPGLALEIGMDIDSTGPLPKIDSLRISTRYNKRVDIDGWGKLTTPIGTFDVLRHNSKNVVDQVVMINTNGSWIIASQAIVNYFNLVLPQPDTLNSVLFMTNSGAYGVPLLSYAYRNKDTTAKMTWLFTQPSKSSINKLHQEALSIYPNPATNLLYVEYANFNGQIQLIDCLGRELYSDTFSQNTSLSLEDYPKGVYFVRLTNEFGETIGKQLLIN
ncbi:MAG: T9SS type A sorting domain-containing protein [Bacteroidia bacterium]|nr:T9SS type A sorting domain-containing protein [Bacteroidia bacterium]